MLQHIYQSVFGYFDWAETYRQMVRTAPTGATLVELGVLLGRSSCFLVVEAANADRGLRTVHIDNFEPIPKDHPVWHEGRAVSPDGTLYEPARANLRRTGAEWWQLWKEDQHAAAARFGAGSVWAVWLDTDHAYASSLRALREWWPKVQAGGWFGGHDYGHAWFPGLKLAVDQWAQEVGVVPVIAAGSWVVRKPDGGELHSVPLAALQGRRRADELVKGG